MKEFRYEGFKHNKIWCFILRELSGFSTPRAIGVVMLKLKNTVNSYFEVVGSCNTSLPVYQAKGMVRQGFSNA